MAIVTSGVLMTDVERAQRAPRAGWAIISGEPAPGSRTDPTSSRYWRDGMQRILNGRAVEAPIPYSLTLVGRLCNAFYRLELETDPEIWTLALPRLRALLVAHFSETIADKVLA